MKLIDCSTPKHPNTFTMVDDEDFEWLNQWKWGVGACKGKLRVSRSASNPRRPIKLHRAIMEAPDGVLVDHINGNTLDNSRTNLRLCNNSQNGCNKHARIGVVGFLGVYKRGARFYAQITIGFRKKKWLGVFDTAAEAALAYNEAAKIQHGEFANLNIIPVASVAPQPEPRA